ncbi:MFS transporter [Actinomadura sp. DC4]|uniref:MFS transporter n=1 Tax=Actinomadura sp. DC4 TaxID=3055069 RepID=UPI0025B08597|nr:MFS transporter [Actinomadura sp. DC4]MDN3358579.1 MFS transporter [Actinomadura sp. DC4]
MTAGHRWTVLAIATFLQATSGFFVQGIGAMSVGLRGDLSLSTAQLGLLLSAAQLAPLAGLLIAGELLDRYDERWVVGTGACVVAVSLGVGSLAPGYVSLLVVGAGYSTVQPGGSKSVASWFGPSQRGLAMGIRQAGLPLGGALAAAAWSDRRRSGRYGAVATCLAAVTPAMTALMTPAGRSPVAACLVFVWLGFFGIGWYGPWVAYVAESAPPGTTGFALGLAMAVTQIAVIASPPALGLLTDLTHGFTPAWALLSAMTVVALVTPRETR